MISVIGIFLITLLPAAMLIIFSLIISWFEDDEVPLPMLN
ncbi:hypothetical protein theurythT_32010 [Thalassotalea eurytherma]|uniref:Uncharacterized protein n=1 Tax=Thalassotalea eurytherma TaxID=1144278 RepID=A0ABQ6H6G8_9GAMM|nr:hypothetical protein theurythT_32010 [Thalassotalea eurytherma]